MAFALLADNVPYDARMTCSSLASLRRLTSALAACGLAFALGACGSDTADIADDETSPTPTETTTSETSPPEPTDATETTDAPEGDVIDGEGYTYAIPEGWEDVGDEAAAAQADSAVRVSDTGGAFGANVNVIVTPDAGVTDIESLRDQFQQQIEGMVDSKVEAVEDTTIAGEPAIGQTASRDQSGEMLIFTQYFVAHEGSIFAITLTTPEDEAADSEAALDTILSSWAWE